VIPVHVVIATHNRPDDLADCVAAIAPQVHHVMVIDNASDPHYLGCPDVSHVVRDEEQPPNLSRLWNIGGDWSAYRARENDTTRWDTLIVNDDFIAGPRFVERLQNALRADHAVVASPYAFGVGGPERVDVYEAIGTLRSLDTRMAGFAFMIRGESGLRLDERFRWYFGDDDVAQQACASGGRVVVHGLSWEHRHPDRQTHANPLLVEQTHRDRNSFVAKWGFEPW
jgi:GT2 family glycosyltransferase